MMVTRDVTRYFVRDSRRTFEHRTLPNRSCVDISTQDRYASDRTASRILTGQFGTIDMAAGL